MTHQDMDELLLSRADGQLSSKEKRQIRDRLRQDPELEALANDLGTVAGVATTVQKDTAPESLHRKSRAELLSQICDGQADFNDFEALSGNTGRTWRRPVLYAVAATLALVIGLASSQSMADVVQQVKRGVRALLLGEDGTVIEVDVASRYSVSGDTLYLEPNLERIGEVTGEEPAIRVSTGSPNGSVTTFEIPKVDGAYSVETSSDVINADGEAVLVVRPGTLHDEEIEAHAKAALGDSVKETTWGTVKAEEAGRPD